jgi:hypothetical protein
VLENNGYFDFEYRSTEIYRIGMQQQQQQHRSSAEAIKKLNDEQGSERSS